MEEELLGTPAISELQQISNIQSKNPTASWTLRLQGRQISLQAQQQDV